MDELVADFLTEAEEGLAQLDVALVNLEGMRGDGQGQTPTVGMILRLMHTLKGTAGFLGMPRLARVAHAAEDVLGSIRDSASRADAAAIDAVLGAVDRVRTILAGVAEQGAEPPGDDADVLAALRDAGLQAPGFQAPGVENPGLENRGRREPATTAAPIGGSAAGVRVAVPVLEEMMALAAELVLTRNQLLRGAGRRYDDEPFDAPLQRLSRLTSDLQHAVMKTRMQPVGAAWTKLPRLVHDLSRGLGKQVDLIMDGGGTELDRQVLEAIRDPLTHLVRNSLDHGLEPPAERRAAGKRDSGRLSLSAGQENGFVVIEVADDGRGLDLDHIRASALGAGLVSPSELAAMDDEAVRGLIFCPGLSTAPQVTAISGRGVGLDVVKANIAALGGTIEVASTPGAGTRFLLRIPLTLAVIHALLVRAGGQRFAIAQSAVAEVVRVGDASDAPEGSDGASVLRVRERTLPVQALARILRLTPCEKPIAPDRHVIVLQIGAATFGLLVDHAPDTEEIVVKPLACMLRHLPVFAGTTILGDGAVVLILDPAGIAEAAGCGGGEAGAPGRAAGEAAEPDGAKTVPLLLFEVDGRPTVVPLGQVARLEQISADDVTWRETASDGTLMPLTGVCAAAPRDYTVLVLGDGGDAGQRRVRLVIGGVGDVVHDVLRIDLPPRVPGLLGAATVGGQVVDVLDAEYWLALAARQGFARPRANACPRRRLLAVDDSAFIRQILVPVLSASGYDVIAVESAAKALRLHEAGEGFDAIISDIEMPEIDGLELVRRLRSGGRWAGLPIIALSSRAGPGDMEAGRAAGFTDYVAKFQHAALLASLARHLPRPADTLAAA